MEEYDFVLQPSGSMGQVLVIILHYLPLLSFYLVYSNLIVVATWDQLLAEGFYNMTVARDCSVDACGVMG